MTSSPGAATGQSKTLPSPSKTGKIPFKVPNTDINAETWFALYGELSPDVVPLICLHGGPGMAHNYILPCAHLSCAPFSRPVILYDQIGCGNSTHLREKRLDADFWTTDLFIAELENLKLHLGIDKFDLLGQSWGGMLGALYATKRPAGLYRLIICNSPANLVTWVEVADRLRKELPEDIQETLTRCENEGKTDTEEYEAAMMVFYERHVCRVVPFPDELVQTLNQVKEDDTVYLTMSVVFVDAWCIIFANTIQERPFRVPRFWLTQRLGHHARAQQDQRPYSSHQRQLRRSTGHHHGAFLPRDSRQGQMGPLPREQPLSPSGGD